MFTKYKNIIIIVVCLVAAFIAYTIFFTGKNQAPLSASAPITTPVEADLIALLAQLKGITLDTAIFDDPIFKSLVDFGQDLVAEPIGRPNPFAPLQ